MINAFRSSDTYLQETTEENSGPRTRSGELREKKFHVLTSSAYEENSDTVMSEDVWGGMLTRGVASALGCGYPSGDYSGSMAADSNGDQNLSFLEFSGYCKNFAAERQNVQSYSAYPSLIIFRR